MARTAWHLCRGFPLHTSSSLRSLCLHKEPLHIAAMCVLYVSAAYIYALSSNTDREHTWAPSFLLLLNLKIKTSSFKLFQDFFLFVLFFFFSSKRYEEIKLPRRVFEATEQYPGIIIILCWALLWCQQTVFQPKGDGCLWPPLCFLLRNFINLLGHFHSQQTQENT